MNTNMPAIARGMVVAHLPSGDGMMCILVGQMNLPGFPVRIGHNGAADALRIDQDPMPGIGTWGIIAFPSGDERNGIWLCSVLPSKMSARNYNGTAIDPFMKYQAHWSGFWSLMDGSGNTALQWPEGSWFSFSSGATLPTVYRTVVQNNQAKQIAYTMSDRVSGSPSPFQAAFHQAGSGLTATVDPSGSVVISGGTDVNSYFKVTYGGAAGVLSSVGWGVTGNIYATGSIYLNEPCYAIGYQTRTGGTAGSYTGHNFNFDWTGAVPVWIDVTDVGNITLSSDYRIKKDVAALPSMWDRIKKLRPISYTQAEYSPPSYDTSIDGHMFKADDVERWGFFAHELQENLIKSAATGDKDQPNLIQSPNLFTLIAALTKALQEAMERIEKLEGRAAT